METRKIAQLEGVTTEAQGRSHKPYALYKSTYLLTYEVQTSKDEARRAKSEVQSFKDDLKKSSLNDWTSDLYIRVYTDIFTVYATCCAGTDGQVLPTNELVRVYTRWDRQMDRQTQDCCSTAAR